MVESLVKKAALLLVSVLLGIQCSVLAGCGGNEDSGGNNAVTGGVSQEESPLQNEANVKSVYTLSEALLSGDFKLWFFAKDKNLSYRTVITDFVILDYYEDDGVRRCAGACYELDYGDGLTLEEIDEKSEEDIISMVKDEGELKKMSSPTFYYRRASDGNSVESEYLSMLPADLCQNMILSAGQSRDVFKFDGSLDSTTVLSSTYFGIFMDVLNSRYNLFTRSSQGMNAATIIEDDLRSLQELSDGFAIDLG